MVQLDICTSIVKGLTGSVILNCYFVMPKTRRVSHTDQEIVYMPNVLILADTGHTDVIYTLQITYWIVLKQLYKSI